MRSSLFFTFIFGLSVITAFPQVFDGPQATDANSTKKEDENAAKQKELKENAFNLLRQTSDEIGMLRTAENRIGFTAELAALLWFYDEDQARELYSNVFQDFRSLATRLDHELNAYGDRETPEDEMYMLYAMMRGKDQAYHIALRKMQKVMALRSSIAMTMVEHDPDLAHKFFYESISAVTSKAALANLKTQERQFDARFLTALAAKNTGKAADFAKRSLKDGVETHHISLLSEIYKKDVNEAISYGAEIFSKLKSDRSKEDAVWLTGQLLNAGKGILADAGENPGKKPVFTNSEMTDIANLLADILLSNEKTESQTALSYADSIEDYAPGRSAQLRSRFKSVKKAETIAEDNESGMPDNYKQYVEQMEKEREEAAAAEKKRKENLEAIGNKDLPAEQRRRITNEARQILLQESDAATKIAGLGALAVVVSKSGDKELAQQIMSDAASLVNPYPKTYVDYTTLLALAAAYAEIQPERSFMLLEGAMGKINQLIASFGTIAEFIDISEDMIIDNEFQVGSFGGGMMAGLTGQLGMAENSIGTLANADYQRLVAIANRFERNEARVLAKMLIIRSLLEEKPSSAPAEVVPNAPNMVIGAAF